MNGLVRNPIDRKIENNYLEYVKLNNWDNKAELFTTLIKNYNGSDKPTYDDFFKLFRQSNKTEDYTLENFEFIKFINFCKLRYDFFIYCVFQGHLLTENCVSALYFELISLSKTQKTKSDSVFFFFFTRIQ